MELNELLRILRRHWFVGLVVLAVVSFVGIQSAYRVKDSYQTTATLIVEPKAGNSQDVQFLMPGFAARLDSRRMRTSAYNKLNDFNKFLVGHNGPISLTASVGDGSNVLSVTAQGPRPSALAIAANAQAQALIDQQPSDSPAKISILDEALRPGLPNSQDRNPIIYGSIALGAILGVFAAIGMEFLRRRLDGAAEIRRRFGTSILGEIPSFRRTLRRTDPSPRELLEGGRNPRVVEAFHRLRTNLELTVESHDAAMFAVVSSAPGEGKSTVATNLGWVLASAGRPVTLIDANLRNPVLHQRLGQRAGPGLGNLVTDGKEHIGRPTLLQSLSLVTAGSPERHPADIVRESLPRLLERYDGSDGLVIVDAPALRGAAETTVIAADVGFVLLVVNARRFDPDEIERSLGELHEANSKVLGVVVNRSRVIRRRRTAAPFREAKPARTSRFRRRPKSDSTEGDHQDTLEPIADGVTANGSSTGPTPASPPPAPVSAESRQP